MKITTTKTTCFGVEARSYLDLRASSLKRWQGYAESLCFAHFYRLPILLNTPQFAFDTIYPPFGAMAELRLASRENVALPVAQTFATEEKWKHLLPMGKTP